MPASTVERIPIDVEGLTARYLRAGTGPPLVLLHGVGTSAREWSWVLPVLAQEGSLELIPCCGHLPHVERPEAFAAVVSRFLAEKVSGGEGKLRDRA